VISLHSRLQVRRVFMVLMVVLAVALPAAAAKKLKVKGQGNNVEVTNDDANGHFKAFRHTANNATITVGSTTVQAVFERDGSITLNGVRCSSNEELYNVITRSGLSAITAEELDGFIGMLQSGEIQFEPKKRQESLLHLLSMWRSKM
jgi:hypothetical protein